MRLLGIRAFFLHRQNQACTHRIESQILFLWLCVVCLCHILFGEQTTKHKTHSCEPFHFGLFLCFLPPFSWSLHPTKSTILPFLFEKRTHPTTHTRSWMWTPPPFFFHQRPKCLHLFPSLWGSSISRVLSSSHPFEFWFCLAFFKSFFFYCSRLHNCKVTLLFLSSSDHNSQLKIPNFSLFLANFVSRVCSCLPKRVEWMKLGATMLNFRSSYCVVSIHNFTFEL